MITGSIRSIQFLLTVVLLILCGGCDESVNPVDMHDDLDVFAWLWAFDDDAGSVSIYDMHDGKRDTSYSASAFGMMHCFVTGPAIEPTVWMAKDNTAYAFTSGFDYSHGDHAHKQTPSQYATVTVGANPVHMGAASSGNVVAFANDGDGTVSVIDVGERSVTATINHGSGHSSALLMDDVVITTAATGSGETWAKIVSVDRDSVIDSLTIGAGAHGDAWYAAGKTCFIAVASGIAIIDVAARTVKGTITYSEPGRTNFLYHGHNGLFAVGLHKTEAQTSDKLLLLDMAVEDLVYLTISGASLPWNILKGQFALSEDGTVAVISDNMTSKIYHITLATKVVKTLSAPGAACAVATNVSGDVVWALHADNVSMISAAENEVGKTFTVASGTDWVFVTSTDSVVVH